MGNQAKKREANHMNRRILTLSILIITTGTMGVYTFFPLIFQKYAKSAHALANKSGMSLNVIVEGLASGEAAELSLISDTGATVRTFQVPGIVSSNSVAQQDATTISLAGMPAGSYRLTISAPTAYLREPQGYFFQVSEAGTVNGSQSPVRFRLIPPSAQDLPPCRDISAQEPGTASPKEPPETLLKEAAVCQAEYFIDLSVPLNDLVLAKEKGLDYAREEYHYVGPEIDEPIKGILGRNTVVDPAIVHGKSYQFVAERVYAANGSIWMEAGWAEVSWREDRQYIYVMNGITRMWYFFDEYPLTPGTTVETRVEWDGDNNWVAELYWNGTFHRLFRESLGFDTALVGYNRGEIYTADGTHPYLPASKFDMSYISLDGESYWRWDTNYPTSVNIDEPYQCDVVSAYDVFVIHSSNIIPSLVASGY